MSLLQRELGCIDEALNDWKAPVMDGNILVTADGFRWRIEHGETVKDLLHVGDTIRTNYGSGGLVVGIHKQLNCSCPLSKTSRTKVCCPHWDGKVTDKYHVAVITWTIVFVPPGARQNKSGTFPSTEHRWINEAVAYDGRILMLFEANKDEVFMTEPAVIERPFQIGLW